MTTVAIVGGGPAGLSAALFTAKNGLETTVFDTDETWMHKAHLFNYLGVESVDGTEYVENAREQVREFGVDLRESEVSGVERDAEEFVVSTEDNQTQSKYLVLATGADRSLAEELDCEFDGETVDVDLGMETSVADAYATGAMVRAQEWQAIISAGDGGAAALDILSKEEGEHFHDFDTPEDAE